MAKQKRIKCPKCDRRFSMAAHVQRHLNTMHGAVSKTKKSIGRAMGSKGMTSFRRAQSNIPQLQNKSLDELLELINEARAEARSRLPQLAVDLA